MKKMDFIRKIRPILTIFLLISSFCINNGLAVSTTIYMCPDVNMINTEPDGAVVPPSGWFTSSQFNMPSFTPATQSLNRWRSEITSILYLRPIVYTWGISFTCIYRTFESTGRGLFMLFKIAPDKFTDKLWDTRTPNIAMEQCIDTNSHGSGNCYWAIIPKQNNS